MSNDLRTAVIGLGNMGSAHARCIYSNGIDGMVLSAVCDIRPERLEWAERELSGAKTWPDYHQMIASGELDAVVIAVPHPLHSRIACEAMKAGLHVLCEKPLDIRLSLAREAVETGRKTGKTFAVMLNQRTDPIFQKAREMITEGRLGTIKRSVWIITNWYRTQHYYDSGDWRATWSGEGGGVLLNQAPHNLDLWQWICGMPTEITARCDVARYHHVEVEDDATIIARYANGATGCFITSTGEYPGTNRLEISGTKGKIVLEDGKMKTWVLREDEQVVRFASDLSSPEIPLDYTEWKPDKAPSAHAGILRNFADSILHGTPLLSPAGDGLNELTLSNAAYLSAWQGGIPVKLPFDEQLFDRLLDEHQASSVQHKDGESHSHEIKGEYSERWQVKW